MFWCKIFQTRHDLVLAICDENLIDKEIEMKGHKVKISKNFYGGKLIEEDVAKKLMEKATIGNLIGKNIIDIAKKDGFITKENAILINGTPHAQFVKIKT